MNYQFTINLNSHYHINFCCVVIMCLHCNKIHILNKTSYNTKRCIGKLKTNNLELYKPCLLLNKGNNTTTELRTILQRESQNPQPYKQTNQSTTGKLNIHSSSHKYSVSCFRCSLECYFY